MSLALYPSRVRSNDVLGGIRAASSEAANEIRSSDRENDRRENSEPHSCRNLNVTTLGKWHIKPDCMRLNRQGTQYSKYRDINRRNDQYKADRKSPATCQKEATTHSERNEDASDESCDRKRFHYEATGRGSGVEDLTSFIPTPTANAAAIAIPLTSAACHAAYISMPPNG
jgi:hypothetical protein